MVRGAYDVIRLIPLAARLAVLGLIMSACTAGGVVDRPTGADGEGPTSGEESPSALEPPVVDPDDIISGGPPPDGIPPIDDPAFLSVDEVDFLDPNEPVLAVEVGGTAKAYPIRILMWHEIVNDRFGGLPVVVTYCPLCNTGIAFGRPLIDGELLDFGTSGKLYHSNLVMYDRQTGSYWAQAIGQAIVGPLVREQLEFIAARLLSWEDWRAAHPDGLVLSTETGFARDYGANPYAGYDGTESPFLFEGDPDPRLPATAHALGIADGEGFLAVPFDELESSQVDGWAATNVEVGDADLAVFWKAGTSSALDAETVSGGRDVGAAAAYVPRAEGERLTFRADAGGIVDDQTGSTWSIAGEALAGPLAGTQLEVAVAIDSFWFDWAAFHPETEDLARGGMTEAGTLQEAAWLARTLGAATCPRSRQTTCGRSPR
jgi:hypothetical protein